jgi:hypothetical protein
LTSSLSPFETPTEVGGVEVEGSYVEVDADADILAMNGFLLTVVKARRRGVEQESAEKERLKGKVKKVDPPPLLSFLISLEAIQRRHSS